MEVPSTDTQQLEESLIAFGCFRGPFGSTVITCRGNVVDATEPIKNLNQRVLIEPGPN